MKIAFTALLAFSSIASAQVPGELMLSQQMVGTHERELTRARKAATENCNEAARIYSGQIGKPTKGIFDTMNVENMSLVTVAGICDIYIAE